MKITDEIFEAYLSCKYKAYLKLNGESGNKTDYEELQDGLKGRTKKSAMEKITSGHQEGEILQVPVASLGDLKEGKAIVVDALLEDEKARCCYDALEKVEGKSKLGNFHYLPVVIRQENKIAKSIKLLVTFKSIALENMQGKLPAFGRIIYGEPLRTSRVRLEAHLKEAQKSIKEIEKIAENEPKLMLNKHCQICEFRERCRAKAVEKDDLSLLGGMSEKEILNTNNKGIFTVHQLSYTFRPRKRRKGAEKPQPFPYALKALAVREKQTYIKEIPKLRSPKTEIYLDFEGLPDENYIYLIGMVIKEGEAERQLSLWADSKEGEEDIFKQFFDTIAAFNDYTIYHYGSYEVQTLRKFSKRFDGRFEDEVNRAIKNSVNVLSLFTSSLYPPTYTNALKDVATFLGFQWSDPNVSGIQSIVWRKRWELSKNTEYKNKLVRYNVEDCLALVAIIDWTKDIDEKAEQQHNGEFAQVKHINPPSVFGYKFGDPGYVTEDFEKINSYAYFDYQRSKIYLRTNRQVRKALKRKTKRSRLVNKPDKSVELLPEKCPKCQCIEFSRISRHTKIVVDVHFMRNGVKKWAIGYHGGSFQCSRCHRRFVPIDLKKLIHCGPNLTIWTVNQYVQYRVSLERLVEMILDLFNIQVSTYEVFKCKRRLAEQYRETYEEIQRSVVKGNLIHADETVAKLRGSAEGYVWVFTNMDSVFYLYRSNREAGFLQDLLKGFSGVLVSDFYPGYDALSCAQQKCLAHLIRDMNDWTLKKKRSKKA